MTEEQKCPGCGERLNKHITIDNSSPNTGDITVCGHCQKINKYGINLEIIPLTIDELDLMRKEDPRTYFKLCEIQFNLRVLNLKNKI